MAGISTHASVVPLVGVDVDPGDTVGLPVGEDVVDADFDVGLLVGEYVVEPCDPVGLLDGADVDDKGFGPSDVQVIGEQLTSSK